MVWQGTGGENMLPRGGSCPPTASLLASTNHERAASPLSRHTSRGEKGGKTPHASSEIFFPSGFTPAFSDPFRRGKGRSVVCGGWGLQAGVVAKMVKWWWWCCGDCGVVGGGCLLALWLVVMVDEICRFKITIEKEKHYHKGSLPDEHEE